MSGGRSESHPSDPGVSIMLVYSGLVKFTKRRSFCCWCGKKARNLFCRVQESMDRLGAWLLKGEYRLEGTQGTGQVGQSRPRDQDSVVDTGDPQNGTRSAKMPRGHRRGVMPGRATPHVHREQVGSETASGPGGAVVRVRQRGNPCQVSHAAQP